MAVGGKTSVGGKTVVTAAGFPTFPSTKNDVQAPGINMVVFGPPGVGKTTFFANLAKSLDKRILLFDLDMGRESILDLDLDYAEPPRYIEAREAGEDLSGIARQLTWDELRSYLDTAVALKDKSPYGAYIFDSLSSIYYELIVPKVLKGQNRKMEWGDYSEAQRLLTAFIRDAKSLGQYGIHTLFTGHQKDEDDDGRRLAYLALPPSARNDILLTVNHVGYLQKVKSTEGRELIFASTPKLQGPKLRQPRSGEQVPLTIPDPSMDKLVDLLRRRSQEEGK